MESDRACGTSGKYEQLMSRLISYYTLYSENQASATFISDPLKL
jgi:hypothetical protein